MDLYHVALFGHIMGAILVVGSGFVFPVILGGVARATSVAAFRNWGDAVLKISQAAGVAAALVMISGIYMAIAADFFPQAWVVVSLVLFVVNGVLAGGVLSKHWKGVMEQAEAAGDGPVPEQLRAAAFAPKTQVIESLTLANDIAIVFLMTNKPGLTGTLVAMFAGFALAGALVARGARQHSGSAVAA